MPDLDTGFSIPTVSEITERVRDDYNTRFSGEDSRLRRHFGWVISAVIAGAVRLLFLFLAFILRQVLPDTATDDYLVRWAAVWGLTRNPATTATGTVTFTGTAATVIAAGTLVETRDDDDNLIQYSVDAPGGTIPGGGTLSLAVTATTSGVDGNQSTGAILDLPTPIVNVDPSVTVDAPGLTGGADEETDAALRVRLLARLRDPPQGGAEADYEQWVRDTDGLSGTVDQVQVYGAEDAGGLGEGMVRVLFTLQMEAGGAPADVIPVAGDVTLVDAYLNDTSRRPVTAGITVEAPTSNAIDLDITLSPNTAAVQAAVDAEIDALFQREGIGVTIRNSTIREAISRAAGETYHSLTDVDGDTTGLSDITLAATEVAIRNTITYS